MDNIELKLNDNGEVVQVVTTTEVQEIPISSAEYQRQIDEHQAIIDQLIPKRDSVKAFEDANKKAIEDANTPPAA